MSRRKRDMTTTKVALVTGAGTGIGKASALALAKAGYNVVLAGRRLEPLETAAREAEKHGTRALAVSTDVGDPASVRSLFAKTKQAFGRLDALFHNAGIGTPVMPFEEIPYETWTAVVDVHMTQNRNGR